MFPYFVGNNFDQPPLFLRLSHPIVFPDPLARNFSATSSLRRSFDYPPSMNTRGIRPVNPNNFQRNYATYDDILINNGSRPNTRACVLGIHEANDRNPRRNAGNEVPEMEQTEKLYFPDDNGMNFIEKKWWTLQLRAAYRDFEVTFVEGLSKPFITVKGALAVSYLTTVGFKGIILHQHANNSTKIIIFDVPVDVDCSSLDFGSNVLWVKRRYVRGQPRQQLIVSIKGPIPDRLFVPSLGYKPIAMVTNLPLLCLLCSRWGHIKEDCIEETYRCRFCSGEHNAQECLEKIRNNIYIPRKCCNCGDAHNASSESCPMRPRTTFRMISEPFISETLRNCQSTASTAATATAAEREQLRIAMLQRALVETELLRVLAIAVRDQQEILLQNEIETPSNISNRPSSNEKSRA